MGKKVREQDQAGEEAAIMSDNGDHIAAVYNTTLLDYQRTQENLVDILKNVTAERDELQRLWDTKQDELRDELEKARDSQARYGQLKAALPDLEDVVLLLGAFSRDEDEVYQSYNEPRRQIIVKMIRAVAVAELDSVPTSRADAIKWVE